MEIWVPVWIISIIITCWIANEKGQGFIGFFLRCIFGPSEIITALASSSKCIEKKDIKIDCLLRDTNLKFSSQDNPEKKVINNEQYNFEVENKSKEFQNSGSEKNKKSIKSRIKEDNSFIFWSFFFITIILMGIFYFIIMNKIETINKNKRIAFSENGRIAVSEELVKRFEKTLPKNYKYIDKNIAVNAKNNIYDIIDEEIDGVFEPVYDQIPKFSDFHYSLSGEYTEIITALSGRISESVQTYLFDRIRFENKLRYGINNIIKKSSEVFSKAIDSTYDDIREELDLDSEEFFLLSRLVEISTDDMKKRFTNYIIDGIRAGGVVNGAGAGFVGALIAKKVGTKVAAKISAKIATKLGIKIAGGAGAATTGAAIGSFLGPAGTAIGGVVGGVAGWLITDKIIIEIDQFINEEDFKNELKQLVTQQKQKMKDTFKDLYGNYLDITADNMKNDMRNIKLKDYIDSPN